MIDGELERQGQRILWRRPGAKGTHDGVGEAHAEDTTASRREERSP